MGNDNKFTSGKKDTHIERQERIFEQIEEEMNYKKKKKVNLTPKLL